MIIGAIKGALIVGGVTLAVVAVSFVVDRTPSWPMGVLTVIGVALAGAGFVAMIGSWSPPQSAQPAPSKPTQATTCSGVVSPSNSHESKFPMYELTFFVPGKPLPQGEPMTNIYWAERTIPNGNDE